MPETNQNNEEPRTAKRNKKRICLAVIVVLAMSVAVHLIRSSGSIHKQLAAIEVARAIPDSENAVLIYRQILDDYPKDAKRNSFAQNWSSFGLPRSQLDSQNWLSFSPTRAQLDLWPNDHRPRVEMLRHACRIAQCRLPLSLDPETVLQNTSLRNAIKRWTFLLASASNRDVERGHIKEAFEKHLLMIQMAKHFYQQPTNADLRTARLPESVALRGLAGFIVKCDANEAQLVAIDKVVSTMQPDWEQDWLRICTVEELCKEHHKKQTDPLHRLLTKLRIIRPIRLPPSIHGSYLRLPEAHTGMLALRRGTRILVALRRYKNKEGHWPHSLNEITPVEHPKIFIDPINNSEFQTDRRNGPLQHGQKQY